MTFLFRSADGRSAAGHPLDRRSMLRGTLAVGAGLALGPLLLSGTAQAYSWSRTMKQGDSGADVLELQIRVSGWAADSASHTRVGLDGDFGPGTLAAVKRFQAAYGLDDDGVAAPTPRRSSTRSSSRTAPRPTSTGASSWTSRAAPSTAAS